MTQDNGWKPLQNLLEYKRRAFAGCPGLLREKMSSEMTENDFDLVVIGGGPGGYASAVRGAQKGLRTILVERQVMGGTCLNRGCVPTKTLLEDTLTIASVRSAPFLKGDLKINFKRIMEHKNSVVEGSRAGITAIVTGNGVKILEGEARFTSPRSVEVRTSDGQLGRITARRIVIATGADVDYGPRLTADGRGVLTTDQALALTSVPASLAVIGAGSRGVEFVSIFHNLGTKVVLVEKERRILPREHKWLSGRYRKILTDRQIKVMARTTVVDARSQEDGQGVILTLDSDKGQEQMKVDKALLTGHRRPSYKGLDPEAAGLMLDDGVLEHGAGMQTRVEGIYVVGDAAGPPYVAHKAIAQGMAAVDHMQGIDPDSRPRFIPHCIYGDPEIGSVGLTEDQARKAGYEVTTGEFYLVGNGRAGTMGKDEGLVHLVADANTSAVLGVHIMAPRATELIALGVVVMQNGVTLERIKKTVLPHMTFAESFFEAALAASGEAIHLMPAEAGLEPDDLE
jgi:dihydrolipoamide dehydrogenase